jgi:hypothetical protein
LKLSWLGNEHISLSGRKETKHEQDKTKESQKKSFLEHDSMLPGQKVECGVGGALGCRGVLEAEKNSWENKNTALLCFALLCFFFSRQCSRR